MCDLDPKLKVVKTHKFRKTRMLHLQEGGMSVQATPKLVIHKNIDNNKQVIWDSWGVSDKGAKTFRQKNPYSNHYSDQHQEYKESDELEDD